jgi:lipopolysaccharide/colanic/teichoic acid biosynthesis glycosyltransferase
MPTEVTASAYIEEVELNTRESSVASDNLHIKKKHNTRHISRVVSSEKTKSSNNSTAQFDSETKEAKIYSDQPDPEVSEAIKNLYNHRKAYLGLRRCLDIAFSLIIMVLFCWLYLLIAIAIKVDDPKGSIIFKQKRVKGINHKTGELEYFNMYKFRSMVANAEEILPSLADYNLKSGPVFKMKNDPRITRVGRILRKLSLDELPQFWNVFLGHISVVGPRPALPSEVEKYNNRQKQRLLIKQGITCYWQTRRDRDFITFDDWVELDLLYIKKCSIWSDIKLIIQTVGCMLTAQGN